MTDNIRKDGHRLRRLKHFNLNILNPTENNTASTTAKEDNNENKHKDSSTLRIVLQIPSHTPSWWSDNKALLNYLNDAAADNLHRHGNNPFTELHFTELDLSDRKNTQTDQNEENSMFNKEIVIIYLTCNSPSLASQIYKYFITDTQQILQQNDFCSISHISPTLPTQLYDIWLNRNNSLNTDLSHLLHSYNQNKQKSINLQQSTRKDTQTIIID